MPQSPLGDRVHRIATAAIASRRRNPIVQGMARVSRSYLDLAGNHSYDAERNGEFRVLRTLGAADVSCVFDVGANDGDWVRGAARLLPRSIFHCFEIVPDTARRLTERTTGLGDRIQVNALGLSDAPGTVDVRVYPDFSEAASASGFEHPGMLSYLEICEVVTGDAYCNAREIKQIDFLKIDTEGLDLQILRGFDDMLTSGAVDVVQFEYGLANISSHALLADFHAFLGPRGFAIGKIWPREVEFCDYEPRTAEDFRGPNYLAVRRERSDLIRQLSLQ